MAQKTVLKVDISCQKCKKKVLKAVSGLPGVDKVEIDGAKGTVSVTGDADADPYEIIVKTRKAGKYAEVVSIGAPPKQEAEKKKPDHEKKPEEKKPQEQQKTPQIHDHISALPFIPRPICERIPVVPMTRWEEPTQQCSIL
ncbi:Copper chaperone [Handroanthus impetiginosus]|uniref:Copper chaperone n=1 Tax=Handroanthus impetiginosus TaxID=429701 RepID=A0A2G9HGH2_9LAMI|nr:Copper chaperone [Handroanthus impetiginosus]